MPGLVPTLLVPENGDPPWIGPGRLRVPEMTQMDRLGFSLCAALLDIIGSYISEYTVLFI